LGQPVAWTLRTAAEAGEAALGRQNANLLVSI
jgi:hypothetical protein